MPSGKDELSDDIAERLMRALTKAEQPLSRRELQSFAGLSHEPDAKLRRWLRQLTKSGKIVAEGRTKGRRYRSPQTTRTSPPAVTGPQQPSAIVDTPIPLSTSAETAIRAIRVPISARPPAGFERAFLDAYRAGETFYLAEATREELATLGRTPATELAGGTYARQILERLLIDLSWNSSRLEGNTYSLLETERLIQAGEPSDTKALSERQMILNHKLAIEWLVEGLADPEPIHLDAQTLRSLHAILAQNLLPATDTGRVRTRPVLITGSTYIPTSVPQLLNEALSQIALTAAAIDDPFEQSLFLLIHIPYLQPFIDVNKRTARLAANYPFIACNLRPLAFFDVPREILIEAHLAVYERRDVAPLRDVFVWAYQRSCARYAVVEHDVEKPDPFRLHHRALIKETIATLIRAGHGVDSIREPITPFAARLPRADQPRFIAVIEAELHALHDGNFARFGLRPSEFSAWAAATREP